MSAVGKSEHCRSAISTNIATIADLPRLRMDALTLDLNSDDFHFKALRLLRNAEKLYEKLLTFPNHREDFEFTIHPVENPRPDSENPQSFPPSSNLEAAITWNCWCINRLRVLYIIRKSMAPFAKTSFRPNYDINRLEADIRDLVEDIYSSVPVHEADFLVNFRHEALKRGPGKIQCSHSQALGGYYAFLFLRSLEVGFPVGPVAGIEFAGGRQVPWSREYIELYAQYPCAMIK